MKLIVDKHIICWNEKWIKWLVDEFISWGKQDAMKVAFDEMNTWQNSKKMK